MRLQLWRISAISLAINVSAVYSASGFEDEDCARLETVQIKKIQEPYKTAEEYTLARNSALQRSYEQAAAQVIGLWIESKRERRLESQQDLAYENFSQLDKAELSGFVRPNITEEKTAKISDQDAVSLDVTVVVCVPKSDFLTKWRQTRAERDRKPPTPVDPRGAQWFDPKTGQPLLWYWKGKSREYSFFDNKGYQPETGDPLLPVTAQIREEWSKYEEKRVETARQLEESKRREAEIRAAQQADALRQEKDRQDRVAHAPELCDQMAGNPYDSLRPEGAGSAKFELLKVNYAAAIEVCQIAVKANPSTPRFRYELARAYQVKDPNTAISILKYLVEQNYPIAYDNYGWALLDRRVGISNIDVAMKYFRAGATLGDPSCMYSLGTLLLDGKGTPKFVGEPERLLQQAAAKGHAEAELRLRELKDQQAAVQQQRNQEEQSRQIFIDILGGVLRNIPRQ